MIPSQPMSPRRALRNEDGGEVDAVAARAQKRILLDWFAVFLGVIVPVSNFLGGTNASEFELTRNRNSVVLRSKSGLDVQKTMNGVAVIFLFFCREFLRVENFGARTKRWRSYASPGSLCLRRISRFCCCCCPSSRRSRHRRAPSRDGLSAAAVRSRADDDAVERRPGVAAPPAEGGEPGRAGQLGKWGASSLQFIRGYRIDIPRILWLLAISGPFDRAQ